MDVPIAREDKKGTAKKETKVKDCCLSLTGSCKGDTNQQAFTNAMVIDLVTKTILENHSDARRTVGASLFTSIQGIIILLNYEDTIHIIPSTSVKQCDFKKIFENA